MKKVTRVITGFLIILGALLLREVLAAAGVFFYAVFVNRQTGGNIYIEFLNGAGSQIVLLTLSAIGSILWILLFFRPYRNQQWREGKHFFQGRLNGRRTALLLIMGLGLQLLINVVLGAVLKIAPQLLKEYGDIIETLGMGSSLISFVYVGFIGPAAEELAFRGFLMGHLGKELSPFWVNIFQAIFFGFYHLNAVQGIYAFLMGLILGKIVLKYGSIREPMILHIAVNISGCLAALFMPEAIYNTGAGLFCIFIMSLVMLAISGKAVTMEKVEAIDYGYEDN